MSIEHAVITDPEIHEPKGVAAATSNKVYISDGLGSGAWGKVTEDQFDSSNGAAGQVVVADGSGGLKYLSMPHGRISFNNVAAPYILTYPSAYAKLVPVTVPGADATEFTESVDGRLTYTGSETRHFHIAVTISADQASGADRDIRFSVYKSGVILPSSEIIMTSQSAVKVSSAMHADIMMGTNDYLEVYAKNDGGSGDIRIYGLYFFAMGLYQA